MAVKQLSDLVGAGIVGDEDLLLIRQGGEDKKVRAAELAFSLDKYTDYEKVGDGFWATGKTFTTYKQYMIYDGEAYSPISTTTLTYTVGSIPDLGFVYQINLNSHPLLSGRNPSDGSAHNTEDISSTKDGNLQGSVLQDALYALANEGDHSAHGNTVTPFLGNDLRKLGKVLEIDAAKDFMNVYVESPVVWWDESDGYFHMVFTGYGDGTGEVQASPCHAKSKSLVDGWVVDATALLSGTGVTGDPDEFGGTGPYILKHNSLYYLFYIGLTASGYEAGTKTLCLATSPSITSPVWTRYGSIIDIGTTATPSEWRDTAIWHPSIVKKDETWYLFFNASGHVGGVDKERIGYASSTNLFDWVVDDTNSPIVTDVVGSWHDTITGDPSVYRQGDFWFMQFFGAGLGLSQDGIAYTTNDEFPLNWRVTAYSPTLIPTVAGNIDDAYAHKPFIYINGGTKYHYYTSVSAKKGTRDISIAVSGMELSNKHYASDPIIKEFTTPEQSYSLHRYTGDSNISPVFDFVHDANAGIFKFERPPLNGFDPLEYIRFEKDNGGGVRILGQSENDQFNSVPAFGTALSMFSKLQQVEVVGSNVFIKSNTFYDGVSDKFSASTHQAYQLVLQSLDYGSGSGLKLRYSTNTPVANDTVIWAEQWIWRSTEKAMPPRFNSGWSPVSVNTTYSFAHLLGGTPQTFRVQFSSNGGENIVYEGMGIFNGSWRFVAADDGATYADSTNVSVRTGASLTAGAGGKAAATHMRILCD